MTKQKLIKFKFIRNLYFYDIIDSYAFIELMRYYFDKDEAKEIFEMIQKKRNSKWLNETY